MHAYCSHEFTSVFVTCMRLENDLNIRICLSFQTNWEQTPLN